MKFSPLVLVSLLTALSAATPVSKLLGRQSDCTQDSDCGGGCNICITDNVESQYCGISGACNPGDWDWLPDKKSTIPDNKLLNRQSTCTQDSDCGDPGWCNVGTCQQIYCSVDTDCGDPADWFCGDGYCQGICTEDCDVPFTPTKD